MIKRVALAAGPLALVLTVILPAPGGLEEPAWRVLGLAVWMASWWMTSAQPLEATSLLPLVVLPLSGVREIDSVARSYADPVIFLFLGGFFLAATLERWGLHRRFALGVVGAVGTDARRVILAFLIAAAFASMWISNTATAVMMLPIAAAVAGSSKTGFSTALMLAVAYGASIGGVATLIGSPPNALFAAAARELAGFEVTFASWMAIGLTATIPMLAACWLILVRTFGVAGPVAGLESQLNAEKGSFGPLSTGERWVLTVFATTAAAWIFRTPKTLGEVRIPGLTDLLPWLTDAGIAIAAAILLFAVPIPRARFPVALDWESARKVPWGVLLLFGGGLALAGAFESSGLSAWIGAQLEVLRGLPLWLVILATGTLFIFLTELTSNTATAAIGMPLMVGVAAGLGLPAVPLMMAAALAASMAFMLPVATPPNAIVFGSGAVAPADMVRAGIRLNLVAAFVITLVVWWWRG